MFDLNEILTAVAQLQNNAGVDPARLTLLQDPFVPTDIEWRIQTGGKKGDRIWAKALAYVDNRAIMQRLDEVCGPENWSNAYERGPEGGVVCAISIRVQGAGWVTKRDGADNTDIEATKGGLSNSMKRAGYQWGIGRYLYNLEETFVECSSERKQGWKMGRLPKDKGGDQFFWQAPQLPPWALPGGSGDPDRRAPRPTAQARPQLVVATRPETAAALESAVERAKTAAPSPEQVHQGCKEFIRLHYKKVPTHIQYESMPLREYVSKLGNAIRDDATIARRTAKAIADALQLDLDQAIGAAA